MKWCIHNIIERMMKKRKDERSIIHENHDQHYHQTIFVYQGCLDVHDDIWTEDVDDRSNSDGISNSDK